MSISAAQVSPGDISTLLFNSYLFIFVFLPLSLAVFKLLGAHGHLRAALAWLTGASLFFYAWWNPAYLGLILVSMLGNYGCGLGIQAGRRRRLLLTLGIVFNLALLGYFKYADFFIDNLNQWFEAGYGLPELLLPLAISFFTFQQIAYLVDVYRGETREDRLLHYILFVVFFPQLIAGPIVHHREIIGQWERPRVYRLDSSDLAVGTSLFVIGLFKKVVLADGVAPYADAIFEAAGQGVALSLLEAWMGALAYSLQIYFDFSGYSDMAIGLARLFGVRLPMNFHSPYQAASVIDFWRRWHITLSRFLRDYLYFPLGGGHRGELRRYLNILIVMLLGGLWHGASWTFVLWGGMHGVFLLINHAWRRLWRGVGAGGRAWSRLLSRLLTFAAVTFAWVVFRADSLDSATQLYWAMAGGNGPGQGAAYANELVDWNVAGWNIGGLLLVVWLLPNTQQWLAGYRPVLEQVAGVGQGIWLKLLRWRPSVPYALMMAVIFYWSVLHLSQVSEYIYFHF